MKTINLDISTKVSVKLNEPILNYLGGVNPKTEWEERTIAAHKIPSKEIRDKLKAEKQKAEEYIHTQEGATKVKEFATETTNLFNKMLGNPGYALEYIGNKRFVFIGGAMRTGGTFLEQKLFNLFDLNIKEYNLHIVHDTLPNGVAIRHMHRPPNYYLVLFEIAEFLVWAKREFKNSSIIIKKRSSFETILPFLYSIFGDQASYLITVRHPIPSGYSMAKKRGFKIDAHDSPDWWEKFVRSNDPITESDWNKLNYIERFIKYWQCSYELVAKNRTYNQNIDIVTYDQLSFEETLNNISKKYNGHEVDMTDFNLIERHYNKAWSADVLGESIERVRRQWSISGLEFPELELK
ncbi:hypothetical protein E3U55_02415 [Filobacillus milosensis]|uniref:Sulfotransferase n=1 Tax=Filobacillus milosensis TaxID=94137 RepID=A0A4Y8IXX0_9BACI|nr:hypothetical protein [Filobacillus milosensis]TFB24374.1 hypothetical protein E3U55_02415 [Filobacillus milosensis]